jgi:hybrid cluster-associated redox disulfide protein
MPLVLNKMKPSNLKELKQRQKTIAELIEKDPDFAEFLEQQGMMCASCPLARFETLDQGAFVHGINPNKLKKKNSIKKPTKKQIKKAAKRINRHKSK